MGAANFRAECETKVRVYYTIGRAKYALRSWSLMGNGAATSRSRVRGLVPVSVIVLAAAGGCTQFDDHRTELGLYHASGHYALAAAALDDPKSRSMYGDKSEVLWKLDRGAVALAMGDTKQAIELLDDAERRIEVRQEQSLADVVTSWTINDRSASYIAEPYEYMYVNVLKLLAQLQAGNISGGATVEARRMASKADMLRDRYLKYDEAVQKSAGDGVARVAHDAAPVSLQSVNEEGEFIESPLGTYLTAVTFMKSGDPELQRVAGKRLLESIRLQRGLIGPVSESDFVGLDTRPAGSANVLVVALSGRGPTKYSERVGPIPLGTIPVHFELPRLQKHPSGVEGARLEVLVGGADPGVMGTRRTERLALVEDLSSVAVENHRRMLPLIYARTVTRYAIKAGISAVVTEGLRRRAHDNDQKLVQIAGVVGGLVMLAMTERADLRCWVFLPGQARVALLDLPPGEHRTRVVYESYGGREAYASPWSTIQVKEDGLTSVVAHYWK